jgi:hypothetical protein
MKEELNKGRDLRRGVSNAKNNHFFSNWVTWGGEINKTID